MTVPFLPTEYATAWILPFTSGGFLYIALVNVVPDLLEESSLRYSLSSSDGENSLQTSGGRETVRKRIGGSRERERGEFYY